MPADEAEDSPSADSGTRLAGEKGAALDASSSSVRWYLVALCWVEGVDQQLLPATFHAMERDLHRTPTQLGQLSLAQSLCMAAAGLGWARQADAGPRRPVCP